MWSYGISRRSFADANTKTFSSFAEDFPSSPSFRALIVPPIYLVLSLPSPANAAPAKRIAIRRIPNNLFMVGIVLQADRECIVAGQANYMVSARFTYGGSNMLAHQIWLE